MTQQKEICFQKWDLRSEQTFILRNFAIWNGKFQKIEETLEIHGARQTNLWYGFKSNRNRIKYSLLWTVVTSPALQLSLCRNFQRHKLDASIVAKNSCGCWNVRRYVICIYTPPVYKYLWHLNHREICNKSLDIYNIIILRSRVSQRSARDWRS